MYLRETTFVGCAALFLAAAGCDNTSTSAGLGPGGQMPPTGQTPRAKAQPMTSSTSSSMRPEDVPGTAPLTPEERSNIAATIFPTADATARSGAYADMTDGTSPWVVSDGNTEDNTVREAFFEFQVSSIPPGTTAVELIVRPVDPGVVGTLYSTSSFNENTLTWNSRPPKGAAIAMGGMVGLSATVELDVTAAVKTPGTYWFVLASTHADGLSLRSREAMTGRPQLVFLSDAPAPSCDETTMACAAFKLINEQRAALGKPALVYSAKLANAAEAHNDWMTRESCFDHVCANEPSIGQRITDASYPWQAYGEATAGSYATAQAAVDAWMAKPDQQAILMGDYGEVGISFATCRSECSHSSYWTADFGTPRGAMD